MSEERPKKVYKVAILVYEGIDVLSFSGPLQIFSQDSHYNTEESDQFFDVQTVAAKRSIRAASSLNVEVDLIIEEILDDLANFDILLLPGAEISVLKKLIDHDGPELHLIRCYTSCDTKRPRMVFSICTGALLLAAAIQLPGMTVTTHQDAISVLQEILTRVTDSQSNAVVHRRFVDGGLLKGTKVQIITSAGVSSGMDATFYIICRLLSAEVASSISQEMEYGWVEPLDAAWPTKFPCFLT